MAKFLVFIRPNSINKVLVDLTVSDFNILDYIELSPKIIMGETVARNKEGAIAKIAKKTGFDPEGLVATELLECVFK